MESGKLILVVDDNPAERDVFATFLEFVGGRVIEAGNGADALRLLENERPRLILLDLSMPTMDGWETMHHLRENPNTSRIPVIALTAQHLEWDRLREAGFHGYLEKPLAPFRVLEEVEACIGPLQAVPSSTLPL